MMYDVPVIKDSNNELPVPTIWRQTFIHIVEAFEAGDFQLASHQVDKVDTLDTRDAERIASNILDYGDDLVSLSEKAWERSIYIWMNGYWDVLVDLMTLEQGLSDLVLFVKVMEKADEFHFTIEDVHVP